MKKIFNKFDNKTKYLIIALLVMLICIIIGVSIIHSSFIHKNNSNVIDNKDNKKKQKKKNKTKEEEITITSEDEAKIKNWPTVKFIPRKSDERITGRVSGYYEVSTDDVVLGNAAIIYYEEENLLSDKEIKETYKLEFNKYDAYKIAKIFHNKGGGLITSENSTTGPPEKDHLYNSKKYNDKDDDYRLWINLYDDNHNELSVAWYRGKALRFFFTMFNDLK